MKCQELEKQKTEAQGKLDELDKEVRELTLSDENSFARYVYKILFLQRKRHFEGELCGWLRGFV